MDRRGLRKTKAAHVNPVPLFILGIVLYILNVIFSQHDVPLWYLIASPALILATGFTVYLIQSRHAENSSPIYFAIFIFLVASTTNLALLDRSLLAAFGISIAYFHTIKFICEDKREDYIINASFFCVLSSVAVPVFIWFLPAVWFIMFEESDRKGKDSFLFLISVIISASVVFGTLYLFRDLSGALQFSKQWLASIIASNALPFSETPLIHGLYHPWNSVEFADSITYCLLALGGVIITIFFLIKKGRMKMDNAVISKVSFIFTIIALVLAYFFPENGKILWIVVAATISVPSSHLLGSEGKHIWIRIYLAITFICALLSIIPLSRLL